MIQTLETGPGLVRPCCKRGSQQVKCVFTHIHLSKPQTERATEIKTDSESYHITTSPNRRSYCCIQTVWKMTNPGIIQPFQQIQLLNNWKWTSELNFLRWTRVHTSELQPPHVQTLVKLSEENPFRLSVKTLCLSLVRGFGYERSLQSHIHFLSDLWELVMIFHYGLVIPSSQFLFTLSITKPFSFSAVRLLDKQRPTLFTAQILYECGINLLLFTHCAIHTYTLMNTHTRTLVVKMKLN